MEIRLPNINGARIIKLFHQVVLYPTADNEYSIENYPQKDIWCAEFATLLKKENYKWCYAEVYDNEILIAECIAVIANKEAVTIDDALEKLSSMPDVQIKVCGWDVERNKKNCGRKN